MAVTTEYLSPESIVLVLGVSIVSAVFIATSVSLFKDEGIRIFFRGQFETSRRKNRKKERTNKRFLQNTAISKPSRNNNTTKKSWEEVFTVEETFSKSIRDEEASTIHKEGHCQRCARSACKHISVHVII